MAKIITTNFGTIADALNKLIINEVKAALRLLPGKRIEAKPSEAYPNYTPSLCHVIVSCNDDYRPSDLSVRKVWLDGYDRLHFSGNIPESNTYAIEFDEDDDMLNITDFHYLIEQIKDELPDSEYPHSLTSADDKLALLQAIESSRQCY